MHEWAFVRCFLLEPTHPWLVAQTVSRTISTLRASQYAYRYGVHAAYSMSIHMYSTVELPPAFPICFLHRCIPYMRAASKATGRTAAIASHIQSRPCSSATNTSGIIEERQLAQRKFYNDFAQRNNKLYRDGYPGKRDPPLREASLNVQFFRNQIKSTGGVPVDAFSEFTECLEDGTPLPDGEFIDVIHTNWARNFELLEKHRKSTEIREAAALILFHAAQIHTFSGCSPSESAHQTI